jgi:predicted nuclease of restriction endonuclease-like RecB superfamily
MLTGNLLRARVTRTEIRPQLVSIKSPKHTERAKQLLELFSVALKEKQSRKDIEDWVAELSSLDVEHKIFKGFAKVLLDRAEFGEPILPVEDPPTAVQIRAKVFALSTEKGGFSLWSRTEESLSNEEIFAQVGQEYGCTAAQIQEYLYSDLRSMHRIKKFFHTSFTYSSIQHCIMSGHLASCLLIGDHTIQNGPQVAALSFSFD